MNRRFRYIPGAQFMGPCPDLTPALLVMALVLIAIHALAILLSV